MAIFHCYVSSPEGIFLYLSTKALDGPSQAQLHLSASRGIMRQIHMSQPNTSQPFSLKNPMVQSDSNGGNKGKHMDNYGYGTYGLDIP